MLDALSEYMKDGLLVLPTHTWAYINADNPRFSVQDSPSCVGILPELFRKRPGVVRSWHPTHSVAALGVDAEAFTAGDERWDTPCARGSVWGKLLDRKAEIVLLGVDLRRNTFIHGIEEWVDIPGRMTDSHEELYTVTPGGDEIMVPSRRHCGLSWSEHFWKVERELEEGGAMRKGNFGDALVRVCGTVETTDILSLMLKRILIFSPIMNRCMVSPNQIRFQRPDVNNHRWERLNQFFSPHNLEAAINVWYINLTKT